MRIETSKLENLLNDLKGELDDREGTANEFNTGLEYEDWEDEKVAWEIKLQKEQARINAMEGQLQGNAVVYANEINSLRIQLEEKRAQLDNMGGAT